MRPGEGDASSQLLVVLSTDEDCFERVCRLRADWHVVAAKWIPDPAQLVRIHLGGEREGDRRLAAGIVEGEGQVSGPVVGIILDLRDPPSKDAEGRRRPTPPATTCGKPLEWPIGAVLTVADEPKVPVLLVSDAPLVESALRRHGVDVVERIGPRDADTVWQRAIHRLVACAKQTEAAKLKTSFIYEPTPHEPLLSLLPAPIRLTPDLAFDASGGRLIGPDGETQLAARENELLGILLRVPGVPFSTDQLARKLSHAAPYPVSEQSVLQTVSGLRRKLDDSANASRILIHRRGYGYAVMVGQTDDSRVPAPIHLIAAAVGSRL